METNYFNYCARFLNRYGGIETIREDWDYQSSIYNGELTQKAIFDYFTNFLNKYGNIETIQEDWKCIMNS